ncbi:hypothetical protein B5M47_03455 [candidate division CPR3 bacterium 4484_211]|uniref:Uncharacterized protein n=1 Tax=candidate division CPR3 bacterium 4484_211 TaxID=1968527 RepID=A0A1W9NX02_UNCC3|nr:MAG: hypothetical protein B5M47_03455 [candidate division CPR3 bacterium 4484_211]
MNLTFFGTPSYVIPVFKKLAQAKGINITQVVTSPGSPIEHQAQTGKFFPQKSSTLLATKP